MGAARRELRCTVSRLQVHRVQTGRQVCRGVYFYGLTLVPMGKDAPPMTEVTEQRRLLRLNGRRCLWAASRAPVPLTAEWSNA